MKFYLPGIKKKIKKSSRDLSMVVYGQERDHVMERMWFLASLKAIFSLEVERLGKQGLFLVLGEQSCLLYSISKEARISE